MSTSKTVKIGDHATINPRPTPKPINEDRHITTNKKPTIKPPISKK